MLTKDDRACSGASQGARSIPKPPASGVLKAKSLEGKVDDEGVRGASHLWAVGLTADVMFSDGRSRRVQKKTYDLSKPLHFSLGYLPTYNYQLKSTKGTF